MISGLFPYYSVRGASKAGLTSKRKATLILLWPDLNPRPVTSRRALFQEVLALVVPFVPVGARILVPPDDQHDQQDKGRDGNTYRHEHYRGPDVRSNRDLLRSKEGADATAAAPTHSGGNLMKEGQPRAGGRLGEPSLVYKT